MKEKDNVGMTTGNVNDNISISVSKTYGQIALYWILFGASSVGDNQANGSLAGIYKG